MGVVFPKPGNPKYHLLIAQVQYEEPILHLVSFDGILNPGFVGDLPTLVIGSVDVLDTDQVIEFNSSSVVHHRPIYKSSLGTAVDEGFKCGDF